VGEFNLRKKLIILNLTINFLIFISILFAAVNVSYNSTLATNNPNENEGNLLTPNQNQITDGGCEKIGGFDDYLGLYKDVFVDGSIAYVSSESNGLLIYDVSNVNNPTLLGTWCNETLSYDTIFKASDYAYLIDHLGFSIVDISTPSSPAFVGNYHDTDPLADIFIDGDYAYICLKTNSLDVIDISDKTNPSYVGGCSISAPSSVYIKGNTACVASIDEGITTVNITDKANPVKLDNMYYSSQSVDVCINEDLAYLASGSDGVYIHDISNPASISLLTQYKHPIFGDYASDVEVSDDLIYVSNGDSFYILNETILEGSFTNDDYGSFSVEDDFAYFIVDNVGCQIFNVSNTTAIELINIIYSLGLHQCIYIEGDYAYVGLHLFGLGIYDVSDPQNPTKVSDLIYGEPGSAGPIYLIVQDDYAYLADGDGLVIVDVSDKNNPTYVGTYDAFQMRGVAVQNDYAFVVGNFDRIQILDISDPANPTEVSNISLPFEDCAFIDVDGDYAYASLVYEGDFVIIDISNVLSPTIVSSTEVGAGTPAQLSVSDDYLFVANSYDLITYDITDKANPSEVSRVNDDSYYIHSNGTVTCAVGADQIIRVYDTSDKANPTIIAQYYEDETDFFQVFLYDNHIFVANLFDGFIVIGFVEITPTTNGFGLNF